MNRVVLADRVLARYAASTRMAGSYQKPFAALAAAVDNWDPLAKDPGQTTKALDLLDKIERMATGGSGGFLADPEDGMSDEETYDDHLKQLQERVGDLREKLVTGLRAAKQIVAAYDALNETSLHLGFK